MVLIPTGEFEMGTDADQIPQLLRLEKQYFPDVEAGWFENETPRHKVCLDAFYMDIYEVSNAQYKEFIDKTGFHLPLYWNTFNFAPNHPVVGMMLWPMLSGWGNDYRPKQNGNTQHVAD
jgi:formylglycine-generating enzyme required for sulfatase activity